MAWLPSGTITLLFTDIEGSTRLLGRLGGGYASVLAEHQETLQQACQAHGGCVVDTQGDSFFVVFARASDAIRAAAEAQQSLYAHPWPEGVKLRVRMGLHTGEPTLTGDRYVGMDVHVAARVGAAAHGGQVLVTQATSDLVAADLPAGLTLRALGEHRLKDLGPRQLYQLVIAGLPVEFPALRSLDSIPNNLPVQLNSFVGREREIAQVRKLLAASRVLTLTGAGGAGKTRLALQVAGEVVDQFKDGVWLVTLDAITDSPLIAPAIASALGLRDESGNLRQTLHAYFREKQVLLVLDNCEHLIQACAQWTDELVRAAPRLTILATSREPLGIAGETVFHMPSLQLPDVNADVSAATIAQTEAVRLFVERASAVSRGFQITDRNAAALAQLVRRLDGIPLALELAAARVTTLTVEQIPARLDDVFRLLTGGSRTAMPRQQTLAAAIDWSYNLLSPAERLLMQRLSVFAGGCTLDDAEQVCTGAGLEAELVLDLLTQLVNKSLVVADQSGATARFSMLETIRQFARYRLFQSEEVERVAKRHRDWCLRLAEEAAPALRGHNQIEWLNRLETEYDNLRAALKWSLEGGQAEPALRLAAALFYFWEIHGHGQEGRGWIEKALALADRDPSVRSSRARAFALLAYHVLGVDQFKNDYAQQEQRLQTALAIFQEHADAFGIGYALHALASIPWLQEDYDRAGLLLQASLQVREAAGDQWGMGNSLHMLAHIAMDRGEKQKAVDLFDRSIEYLRRAGDRWILSHPLLDTAIRHWKEGDLTVARSQMEEILTTWRELGNQDEVGWTFCTLSRVARDQGDFAAARDYAEQAARIARARGDKYGLAWACYSLGTIAWYMADLSQARSCAENALELLHQLDEKNTLGLVTCLGGSIDVWEGRYAAGTEQLHKGLALLEHGYPGNTDIALYGLAEAARRQGDLEQASAWFGRLLHALDSVKQHLGIPDGLEGMAYIAVARGQSDRATRLLGAAAAQREHMGAPIPPVNRADHQTTVDALASQMGADEFQIEWQRGRQLGPEPAITYALRQE